jgi:hypothetical protein
VISIGTLPTATTSYRHSNEIMVLYHFIVNDEDFAVCKLCFIKTPGKTNSLRNLLGKIRAGQYQITQLDKWIKYNNLRLKAATSVICL